MARRIDHGGRSTLSATPTMALTCSANTLRRADLSTRASAAAAAGFTGLGLRVADYLDCRLDDAAIRDLLDEHGLRILELEHTWDWAAREVDPVEQTMFRLADRIGVRQLNVPMFDVHPVRELTRPFGALCDRAAAHGVLVGFEFLPYSQVRTLREAWEVVASADRPNGGLILDLWHWFRSGATLEDLAGIPVTAITSLQLCDVLAQPRADQAEEARHHRQLPGRGSGATPALLEALRRRGLAVPVSVEVFSDELDALPAATAARLAFDAGADTLARAGLPAPAWRTNLEEARG